MYWETVQNLTSAQYWMVASALWLLSNLILYWVRKHTTADVINIGVAGAILTALCTVWSIGILLILGLFVLFIVILLYAVVYKYLT